MIDLEPGTIIVSRPYLLPDGNGGLVELQDYEVAIDKNDKVVSSVVTSGQIAGQLALDVTGEITESAAARVETSVDFTNSAIEAVRDRYSSVNKFGFILLGSLITLTNGLFFLPTENDNAINNPDVMRNLIAFDLLAVGATIYMYRHANRNRDGQIEKLKVERTHNANRLSSIRRIIEARTV